MCCRTARSGLRRTSAQRQSQRGKRHCEPCRSVAQLRDHFDQQTVDEHCPQNRVVQGDSTFHSAGVPGQKRVLRPVRPFELRRVRDFAQLVGRQTRGERRLVSFESSRALEPRVASGVVQGAQQRDQIEGRGLRFGGLSVAALCEVAHPGASGGSHDDIAQGEVTVDALQTAHGIEAGQPFAVPFEVAAQRFERQR